MAVISLFGQEHSSAIFGTVYTGKAVGSVLAGPAAAAAAAVTGSWDAVILMLAAGAAASALVVAGPIRRALAARAVLPIK